MTRNVPRIVSYITAASISNEMETSYDAKIVPLGSLRLKLIELLHHLMRLNKDTILLALGEQAFLGTICQLIERYPWNNFLQLKVISIFEDLLDSSNVEFRKIALTTSNIGQIMISLSKTQVTFDHISGRPIRHGHMAVIVRVANMIIKSKDKADVAEYLESMGEEWV